MIESPLVYPLMGMLTLSYVFFKAFQQKNVIHNNWLLVPFGSYGLAVLETAVPTLAITDIMSKGWLSLVYIAIANGTGGFIGCWIAMYMHNRIMRTKYE